MQVLEDHSRPVLSLAIADNKLFSGSYDYTIKVWSLDTLQRLKTLTGTVHGRFHGILSIRKALIDQGKTAVCLIGMKLGMASSSGRWAGDVEARMVWCRAQ